MSRDSLSTKRRHSAEAMGLTRWTLRYVLTWSILQGITCGIVAIGFHPSLRSVAVSFGLLECAGCLGAVLMFGGLRQGGTPTAAAWRFALAACVTLIVYLSAATASAYVIGLISREAAMTEYGPYVLPVAIAISGVAFRRFRHDRATEDNATRAAEIE